MLALSEVAMVTERAWRPDCAVLGERDAAVGNALLARDASAPFGFAAASAT